MKPAHVLIFLMVAGIALAQEPAPVSSPRSPRSDSGLAGEIIGEVKAEVKSNLKETMTKAAVQDAMAKATQAMRTGHLPVMEGTLQGGLSGRWWNNPAVAGRLGLTEDQQKKMDDIFQQSRLKLIDLTAAVDKEEVRLEPLVEADQPDPAKIRSQIDHIAQARSDLEKANANMLLGIRMVLTPDQWKDLRKSEPLPHSPKPKTK
jgi:Spy/CpxP family protein refolding chaperone